MTDARETLVWFLSKALAAKRERLCQFASKRKTQHKFFSELCHEFGEFVSPSVIVPELSATAWSAPALSFVGPNVFGTPFNSLDEAWDDADLSQGALVITTDGRFGVWCDHHRWDDCIYIALGSGIAKRVPNPR